MPIPRAGRLFVGVLGLLACSLGPAQAQIKTSAQQALLIDMSTDQVLLQKNADEPSAPSSMAKLMTLYILFEDLKAGRITLDGERLAPQLALLRGGRRQGRASVVVDGLRVDVAVAPEHGQAWPRRAAAHLLAHPGMAPPASVRA